MGFNPSGLDSGGLNPLGLMPKRNQTIVERVAALIFRAKPDMGPQPEQQDTSQTGTVAQTVQTAFERYFKTEIDRLAVYKDVEEMDDSSEETSVVLDTIADNVCSSEDGSQFAFEVVCDDVRAKELMDKMLADTDLPHHIYSIARNTIKYGDNFMEIVVNRDTEEGGIGRVVAVKQLPPASMTRNEDQKGNLKLGKPKYDRGEPGRPDICLNKKGECAYEQLDEETQAVIASFYPWQIIHTRFNWDGFSRYGRSLLRVTRVIWRKMRAEEEALIIGRLTRAYLKLVFHVDTTGLSKDQKKAIIKEFQESITQRHSIEGRRENPWQVMSDVFLADGYVPVGGGKREASRTRVELIDPRNEGLSEIADIEFLHRKKLSTLRVPPAHLGFEKDINAKATLTMQDVQYVRFLRRLQTQLSQSIQKVIDVQLLLHNVDPKQVEYKIKWPSLSAANEAAAAQSELWRASADQIYSQLGVYDAYWIQKHRYNMDDVDIEAMSTRIDEQKQEELEQQNVQHQRQLEIVDAQGKARAQDGSNGSKNGKSSADTQGDGNGRSRRSVASEVSLLDTLRAELEGSHVMENVVARDESLRVLAGADELLDLVRREGAEIPVVAREPVINLSPRIETTLINPPPVIPIPEVKVEVKPLFQPEPQAITIENKLEVPTPEVKVEVHNELPPAPNVNVTNEVKTPDVKVEVVNQAPDPGEVEVIYDAKGRVKGAKRKSKKGDYE